MKNLKVTFLGTGTSQGVPLIACSCAVCTSTDFRDKRLRSSILVEASNVTSNVAIVIDTGPDFRYQMLRQNIKRLDAVVFTHEHKDHVAGLDDVRGFNYVMKRPMKIFATQQVQDALKREFYYAFVAQKHAGLPQLDLQLITNQSFVVDGIPFEPIEMMHDKMPVFGYRIDKFAYLTDVNYISPQGMDRLKGVEILVIDALQESTHRSHFSLGQALDVIEEISPKSYLTHISHRMPSYTELMDKLPNHVFPAYDGLVLKI